MRKLALVPALLLASCVVTQPGYLPRPIDRRLVLGEPGLPQVVLEADWRLEGGRYCVSRAPVDVLTAVGPVRLHDADLCATPRPAAIDGEAQVPLPALGFLVSLVTGQAPRGRLSLARGRELGALAIGGERLPADPTRLYLTVDYAARYDVGLGHASLALGGATPRMIVDPFGPVLYVAGDLAGLLATPINGAVFGLSPTGAVPYASAQPLYDGRVSAVRRLEGHLLVQGSFPLAGLPLAVTGRVVVDLDADDDGQTALAGDAGDVQLGGDVMLRVDYGVGAMRLGVELAQASLFLDAGGTAYFSGAAPARLFAGSALSAFEPAGELAVQGVYHSTTDFALRVRGDGRLAGLPLSAAEIELGSGGVKLAGQLEVPRVGQVAVAGAVAADGGWALAGRAGDLTYAGLPITNVEVSISSRGGTTVAGSTTFLGRPFRLAGTVRPGGALALSGTLALSSSSHIQLTVDSLGARAAFIGRVCAGAICVDVPVTELDSAGNVCPSFPVVGRRCVRVM